MTDNKATERAKYDWHRWLIALDRDMSERPGLWVTWVKGIKERDGKLKQRTKKTDR
jgi:hypothetical protein